ncbi:hypothetical protein T492DRAFT_930212 [Pavlovales sp. CCMP2436]|nr:hypothetical protein T492DRAFT_930212 [Pavlovales sp. CCMP2436]
MAVLDGRLTRQMSVDVERPRVTIEPNAPLRNNHARRVTIDLPPGSPLGCGGGRVEPSLYRSSLSPPRSARAEAKKGGGRATRACLSSGGMRGMWDGPDAADALRATEKLEDSDDDLGSPLPNLTALPRFCGTVLRNNETLDDFLAWCACDDKKNDPRKSESATFSLWCGSASTVLGDRASWANAFSAAPSFEKRRQLMALGLVLTKAQLQQLALAHQREKGLRTPAIVVDVSAVHGSQLRYRRAVKEHEGSYRRQRSNSSPASALAADLIDCSSLSGAVRCLNLSNAGVGDASAFASAFETGETPARAPAEAHRRATPRGPSDTSELAVDEWDPRDLEEEEEEPLPFSPLEMPQESPSTGEWHCDEGGLEEGGVPDDDETDVWAGEFQTCSPEHDKPAPPAPSHLHRRSTRLHAS